MLVVADTTPINYLVLTDSVEVLPQLFRKVVCPTAVLRELLHPRAPASVRGWGSNLPTWLMVQDPKRLDPGLTIGPGENAAIALAEEIHADRLLVDERDARALARHRGLQVVGTLSVLDAAASRGLIDIVTTVRLLRTTHFHASEDLLEALLARQRKRERG